MGENQRINTHLMKSVSSIPVHYYTFDKRTTVRLSTNEIAFLAKTGEQNIDDKTGDEFIAYALDLKRGLSTHGLLVQRYYTYKNMIIYQLEKSLDRRELFTTINAIRTQLGEQFYAIGAVLRTSDDSLPIIINEEAIIQFRKGITQTDIKTRLAEIGAHIVSTNPYIENFFVVRISPDSSEDPLSVSNKLQESGIVNFAHPNFITFDVKTETLPSDPLFNNQWHHRNTGQASGTVDADADTATAWDFTTGDANIIIAVFDDGFELTHPDLQPNIFQNTADPVDGLDNDNNLYVDDNQGWDFTSCPPAAPVGCGDNDPGPEANNNHGTAVAGSAAARGGNGIGVAGACQHCRIMPLRGISGISSDARRALVFGYAQANGATIMNNSWTQNPMIEVSAAVQTAINNAFDNGLMIFFAGGNSNNADSCNISYPSLANVVAVSSATNQDMKVVRAAYGNCIDVLAPSHRGFSEDDPYTGTLNITTTDRTGGAGYNSTNPVGNCPSAEMASARDYTACFFGTSFASPLTAGIAGLIFSANPELLLTPRMVQQAIQDTTDRIEPTIAKYDPATGFSSPDSGIATHSWGRINAAEAVQLVAPAPAGKAGVDVFLRDNALDWGNTNEPSNTRFEVDGTNPRGFEPHYRSVDIKVDAPPLLSAPPTNHQEFEAFVHENPRPGVTNRIYIRVRNRGPQDALNTVVKVHWSYAGAGLPALPNDFWTAFPSDSSDTATWRPIGLQMINQLPYSGATAAGCPGRAAPACGALTDNAAVVTFDFVAPALDASLPNHYCLFAVVEAENDVIRTSSLVPDIATPRDNNVTHRNIKFNFTDEDSSFSDRFFVHNPFPYEITTRLDFAQPKGWDITVQPNDVLSNITLQPGEKVLVHFNVITPQAGAVANIDIRQQLTSPEVMTLGGFSYFYGREADLSGGGTSRLCAPFCSTGTWSAAFFGGVNFPHGNLNNVTDGFWSLGTTVRYQRTDRIGFGLFVGYDRFDSTVGASDPDYSHISPEVSWILADILFEPRVHAGVGAYFNSDSNPGFNIGGSASTPLSNKSRAELRYDYRYVDGGNIGYSVLLVGLRALF